MTAESQINTERLVGHVAAAVDLARQILRRRLCQTSDDAGPPAFDTAAANSA
jgi:hypothetical protein